MNPVFMSGVMAVLYNHLVKCKSTCANLLTPRILRKEIDMDDSSPSWTRINFCIQVEVVKLANQGVTLLERCLVQKAKRGLYLINPAVMLIFLIWCYDFFFMV